MLKRIITSSFHSITSRVFITATNLFIVYFVSKNFGNEELGTYGIVFFFFLIVSTISSQAQYLFFSKELAKYDRGSREESVLFNEFITISLSGIILAAIFPLLIALVYKKISFTLLALASGGGYFLGVERNLGGILLGKERMHVESVVNFLLFLVVVVPMVFFKRSFDSIEKIISLRIVALIVAIIGKLVMIKDNLCDVEFSLKQRLFKEGKYYWFTGISNITLREADVIILSFFIDKSLLGVYFLALRIFFAFGILSEVLAHAISPFISRTYIGKESKGFKEFNKIIMVIVLAMGSISSIVLFISREFFVSIFSKELVSQSGRYLLFFSILIFFRFCSHFTGIILTSTEFQKTRFYIAIIASFVMIILDIVLAQFYQIEGVILSRTIVELGIFFSLLYYVRKVIKNYNLI